MVYCRNVEISGIMIERSRGVGLMIVNQHARTASENKLRGDWGRGWVYG